MSLDSPRPSLKSKPKVVVEAYTYSWLQHHRMSLASKPVLALMAGFTILLALGHGISHRKSDVRASHYHSSYRSASNESVTPPLTPQTIRIGDTPLYYMIPKESTRGLLIFFHGCNHSGQDMFQLPEDRMIALTALNRGLAVLSMTSQDRTSGCWSGADQDTLRSNRVVDAWMRSVGLPLSLPRVGMGASSGGSFLFSIYDMLDLQSMASYVSPRSFPESALSSSSTDNNNNKKKKLPATMFVHMPRDTGTAQRIDANVKKLEQAGIPTQAIAIEPHPFTRQQCDRRLPELGDRRCEALFASIEQQQQQQQQQETELLDASHNVMVANRNGAWDKVLAPLDKVGNMRGKRTMDDDPLSLMSPTDFGGHTWLWAAVNEEVAVSYARHETTAERMNDVLDFLMSHAGIEVGTSVGSSSSVGS